MVNKKLISILIGSIVITSSLSAFFIVDKLSETERLATQKESLLNNKNQLLAQIKSNNEILNQKAQIKTGLLDNTVNTLEKVIGLQSSLQKYGFYGNSIAKPLNDELNIQVKYLTKNIGKINASDLSSVEITTEDKRNNNILEFVGYANSSLEKTGFNRLRPEDYETFSLKKDQVKKQEMIDRMALFLSLITEKLQLIKSETGGESLELCNSMAEYRKRFQETIPALMSSEKNILDILNTKEYQEVFNNSVSLLYKETIKKTEQSIKEEKTFLEVINANNSDYALIIPCGSLKDMFSLFENRLKKSQTRVEIYKNAPSKVKAILKPYCEISTKEKCVLANKTALENILLMSGSNLSGKELDKSILKTIIYSAVPILIDAEDMKSEKINNQESPPSCNEPKDLKKDLLMKDKKLNSLTKEILSKVSKQKDISFDINNFQNVVSFKNDPTGKTIETVNKGNLDYSCQQATEAFNKLNLYIVKAEQLISYINTYQKTFKDLSVKYCKNIPEDECQSVVNKSKNIFFANLITTFPINNNDLPTPSKIFIKELIVNLAK